jgi:hypothetical protein
MPAPELPNELWLEITKYLPRSQVQQLLLLNRALLSIARDEIYKDGCLVDNTTCSNVWERAILDKDGRWVYGDEAKMERFLEKMR